jgi:rare lipoprotein A
MRRNAVVVALGVCCLLSLLGSREAQARTTIASWYGPGFAGNITASGERFNPSYATAAHRSLPFGTPVRVCYRGCIRVTINDRGPYANGAEFDLSRGSARMIGLTRPGVAPVRVSVHRDRGAPGGAWGGTPKAGSYTVRRGDTLSAISQRLGVSVGRLAATNGISDPDVIYAGELLRY